MPFQPPQRSTNPASPGVSFWHSWCNPWTNGHLGRIATQQIFGRRPLRLTPELPSLGTLGKEDNFTPTMRWTPAAASHLYDLSPTVNRCSLGIRVIHHFRSFCARRTAFEVTSLTSDDHAGEVGSSPHEFVAVASLFCFFFVFFAFSWVLCATGPIPQSSSFCQG
jgi:hypothetical protein